MNKPIIMELGPRCDSCGGTGTAENSFCLTCRGKGIVDYERRYLLATGESLPMPGKGEVVEWEVAYSEAGPPVGAHWFPFQELPEATAWRRAVLVPYPGAPDFE